MGDPPKVPTLLIQVLRLLNAGGIHTMPGVAKKLGISESMAGALCVSLAQRGYLLPVDTGCGSTCGGCSRSSAEGPPDPGGRAPRVLAPLSAAPAGWALTGKGRKAAESP